MAWSYSRSQLPVLTLLILLCTPILCPGQEIGEILINGTAIDKAEGSEWISDEAVVEIKDSRGGMRLSISVEPDSGLVTLAPSSGFNVTVSEDETSYEEHKIAVGYSIKKFKIETRQDEDRPQEDLVVLRLCCDYDIELGLEDVFLLPIAYKIVRKWPWSWFFPKKKTLTVLIEQI